MLTHRHAREGVCAPRLPLRAVHTPRHGLPFALCTRCPGSSAGCRRDPRAGPSRGVPNQWTYSIHGLIRRIALAGFSVEDRCRNPRAEALAARAKKGGYRPPIKGASRGRPPLIAARRDTKKVSRGFVRQSARLPEAAKKPAGFHVLSAIGVQIPSRRSRRPMMPRTKRAPRTGKALPGALCCQPWAWAAGPVTPLQERKRHRCTALPQHLRRRPDGMKKRRQREGQLWRCGAHLFSERKGISRSVETASLSIEDSHLGGKTRGHIRYQIQRQVPHQFRTKSPHRTCVRSGG
jgi:hypothetical protein